MYPGADFYGLREIFLEYAGVPKFLPLPVAVQHGWLRVPTTFETMGNPPEIWVWSKRMAVELEAYYPATKIRVVGAGICYLKELLKEELPNRERSGSICIPPHSSHLVANEYSAADFARRLNDLGDEYKPITVMLYYLDMTSGVIREYEKFGFEVVSNGSLFDEEFLRRFLRNVYGKNYCIYSELGSGVLFSSDMGLNLVRLDIESLYINNGERHVSQEYLSRSRAFDEEFLQLMNSQLLSEELGKECMLTKNDLRMTLLRNYFTLAFLGSGFRRFLGWVWRKIKNIEVKS